MSWDLTGQRVTATYLRTVPFTGTVVESRVKYGGTVQHTVELDAPMPHLWHHSHPPACDRG